MGREAANAIDGFFRAGTEEEIIAIRIGDKHLWVFDIGIKTVAMELQVSDNLRSQQAHDIRARRHCEARKRFFERTCSSYAISLLYDDHFFPCTRQIACRYKAIVSSANDNRIELTRLVCHNG